MQKTVWKKMSLNGWSLILKRPVSTLYSTGREIDTAGLGYKVLDPPPSPPAPSDPPNFDFKRPLSSILRTTLFPARYRKLVQEILPKPKAGEKHKKLKRPKHTKGEERYIFTRYKREGVDLDNPDLEILRGGIGHLLHQAIATNRPEYLEATLALIDRSKVRLKEEHSSVVLLAMSKCGWYDSVKTNFRSMEQRGIEWRLEMLFSVVKASLERRDFQFALEVMRVFVRIVGHRDTAVLFPMWEVVEGCEGGGEEEGRGLVELVLQWYAVVGVDLDRRVTDAIVKWIQSLRKGHEVVETEILPNGRCQRCGEDLNAPTLSLSSHHALLEAMESLIVKLEKERLRPSKFIFPSIKTFLKGQKFGAVLDGMNAASARFGRFNYDTLVHVAEEMEQKTGLPSLVILRKYCSKMFPSDSDASRLSKDSKYYFIYNKVDDDLYTMYAALASGPHTFLVSNDQLGDKLPLLPSVELRRLLKRWLNSRQVHMERKKNTAHVSLLFHQRHRLNVRSELTQQLHLPYAWNKCMCIKFNQQQS